MTTLNIMVGNIGSGKSLIAKKLVYQQDAVLVNMDTITKMIGGYEYNKYDVKKKEVYHAAEESIIDIALRTGFSVVIDRTNMDRKRRARFLEIGKKYASKIVAYNFGEGNDESLNRRLSSPNGVPADIWRNVYEYMKKSYEVPTIDEGFSEIIDAPQKYKFYAFDFDGTIVENKFPKIGEILDGTVEYMNRLYVELSNIIIVWTCRSGDFENQIRRFMCDKNIPFDFINENPMFNTGSPKIYAHEYYDDRNMEMLLYPSE